MEELGIDYGYDSDDTETIGAPEWPDDPEHRCGAGFFTGVVVGAILF